MSRVKWSCSGPSVGASAIFDSKWGGSRASSPTEVRHHRHELRQEDVRDDREAHDGALRLVRLDAAFDRDELQRTRGPSRRRSACAGSGRPGAPTADLLGRSRWRSDDVESTGSRLLSWSKSIRAISTAVGLAPWMSAQVCSMRSMCWPSSIWRARCFSSAAESRKTLPISRRYMRTGSSIPSWSSSGTAVAASRSSSASGDEFLISVSDTCQCRCPASAVRACRLHDGTDLRSRRRCRCPRWLLQWTCG